MTTTPGYTLARALLAGAASLAPTLAAQAQAAAPAPSAAGAIALFNSTTGKDAAFADFFVDDAAAHVSAAALVGIATSAVTIAEAASDIALFAQGLGANDKGAGLAISPARMRSPWPKVDLKDYLNRDPGAVLLAGLSISFAQGYNAIGNAKYVRRALAVTTSGTFRQEDDPIWVMVNAVGPECAKAESLELQRQQALQRNADTAAGKPASDQQQELTGAGVEALKAALSGCITRARAKLDQRWFRPIWSVTLASGDVRPDLGNAQTVRLGNTLAIAARFGQGVVRPAATPAQPAQPAANDFDWGWAISASAKAARHEPVLSTLGSASLKRQDSTVVALKLAAGTAVWRAVAEASNARVKAVEGGDRTLRQAVGMDYKFGAGWWLNFRYGKRDRAGGAGEEAASLLSLTVSPSALLKVN